jgi:hypothetical protein
MSITAAPLLLSLLLPAEGKPAPKLPLGKETTYVRGPLDGDGYVDYEAALNDRLGKGITAERNANVLLWKALGPTPEGGSGMPAEFFKRLGMEGPPKGGPYFTGLNQYAREHLKLAPERLGDLDDQQGRAAVRPWAAKDYPHLAAWLKANERPLALVVEATRRPEYFNPLVSRRIEGRPGGLLGALLPGVQKCRELANALAARAMLRVAAGQYDAAWQDLLACHRLGRLLARGATLIEGLVGIAVDQIASQADLAYLERANLTSRQARERLKDLQGPSPLPPLADKLDLGERFMYLDCVQLVRRGGVGMLEDRGLGSAKKPNALELHALGMIDWGPALRNGNRWYDRMAAAARLQERAEREKEFDKIEADLRALKKEVMEQGNLANRVQLLFSKDKPKEIGKAIGNVLVGLLVPAVRKVQSAYDRSEQVQRNLRVAFALAAYRADRRRYPARLEELAPKYLAAVPGDLFSGQALIYRPAGEGYLVYSVGVNGKDEGGRWYDDDPPGDDPCVRLPLPELKRKK